MGWETIVALLAAGGIGSILTAVVQHFLGKKARKIDGAVKLGNSWDQFVEELKADRTELRGEVCDLRVWREKASKQISILETSDTSKSQLISALQDENENLAREVDQLKQENHHLSVRITALQDRIRLLEEENKKLKRENEELRQCLDYTNQGENTSSKE